MAEEEGKGKQWLVDNLQTIPEICGLDPSFYSLFIPFLSLEVGNGEEKQLIQEGEPQEKIFFVLKGKIKREKHGIFLDDVSSPHICGILHAFRQDPTFASLYSTPGSIIYSMSRNNFQELLLKHPQLSMMLLEKFADRLRSETKWQRSRMAEQKGIRVVLFDSKSYDVEAFEKELKILNQKAPKGKEMKLQFLDQRLSSETAPGAINAHCVCTFVNDVVNKNVLEQFSKYNIKMIALRCAGYDSVDLAAASAFELPVVRVPAYSPRAVAEHAIALMLSLARSIHRSFHRTREGNFNLEGLCGLDIHSKTIGVIGTGKIGKCFASIAKGFGSKVIAYDVYPDKPWAEQNGFEYLSFDEVLKEADIISIHCPLFPSTKHLINKEAVGKMKRGVMLLNTSRGAIVDTNALLDGLETGKIGFAGLDVYENERPYFFQDHSNEVISDAVLARLGSMNNVLLTGHQAYLTQGALSEIARVTLENISNYFWSDHPEEPLPNQVTLLHRSSL